MEELMVRYSWTSAVALVALSSSLALAQSTTTGTIPAKAIVGAAASLTDPSPIDFGALSPGGSSANVPPSYSATVPHAGSIQVSVGRGRVTLNVTIDAGNELTPSGAV